MTRGRKAGKKALHSHRSSRSVVIIGGGVMGCAAAHELSRRGVEVTVLERSVPGAEASSAAAGILGAQVEAHHPGPLTELGLQSGKLYPELVKELERVSGVSIGYRRSGVLKVAYAAGDITRLGRELAWQSRARLPLARLTRAELLARQPALSPEVCGSRPTPRSSRARCCRRCGSRPRSAARSFAAARS